MMQPEFYAWEIACPGNMSPMLKPRSLSELAFDFLSRQEEAFPAQRCGGPKARPWLRTYCFLQGRVAISAFTMLLDSAWPRISGRAVSQAITALVKSSG